MKVLGADASLADQRGAFDDAFQLAHVPGPGRASQLRQRFLGQRGPPTLVALASCVEKGSSEGLDVFDPLSKWRNHEGGGRNAKVQIGAKSSRRGLPGKIAVRRRDETNVDRTRVERTEAANRTLFEDPEELRL